MLEDPRLNLIVLSVERIARKAYELVQDLHHVDAEILNTFQVGTMTQDPVQRLQNTRSLGNYIYCLQSLVCYYIRVFEGLFERDMFIVPEQQRDTLHLAFGVTEQLQDLVGMDVTSDSDSGDREDNTSHDLEAELDDHIFDLLVALIQQRGKRVYDNSMMSFCAARSSLVHQTDKTITWRPEGEISGILSKLVYCCQLMILQKAQNIANEQGLDELAEPLEQLCKEWVLSNSRGPVGTLDDWRLHIMRVGASTVPPALVVWDHDDRTLTYGDDNSTSRKPGYSFLNDTHNAVYFERHNTWLVEQLSRSPDQLETVFATDRTDKGDATEWPVRAEFAKQYQVSVEQFLEHLVLAIHKGSGQPARREEFLSMRWRNTPMALCNVRLYDGHVLFILEYHKSMTRTHATRSPVRVVFPEVAQLSVRFLVVVQPFRTLVSSSTEIPIVIGDYLWSSAEEPWPAERFTRILTRMSRLSLGRSINTQAWRQICVAIAIKHFRGQNYEMDADVPGNADDHLDETTIGDGVTLPVSFHAQAAHSTHTGNRAYGDTVNFGGALTDAGVQVYVWTTPVAIGATTSGVSCSPRRLRRWGPADVADALHRLYRDPHARFRSPIQQRMVETVAARFAEVIVVLATGAGKSLTFMVPMFLRQAGTTVVVVPLVALKQDLVRRCWDAGIEYSVRQLDRIVFDEAHLILTASDYRPKMALLRFLRDLRCQVVFLTATLPPILIQQFQQRMLLEQPQIIRDVTFRRNLQYVIRLQREEGEFTAFSVAMVRRTTGFLAEEERLIVYANSRDDARLFASEFSCESFYSDSGSPEEKEQVMTRWRDRVYRVIIATSAFGAGIDYAYVRVVIHIDMPRDAINFSQEVDRAGRDGKGPIA
ncbi:hypothetical protein LTS07_011432 [Exophiala sideris]|uniref:DNA 3'-5' helicase n=1 Tax=Exophiala sideris TaxID=1016849 RepID=A0ABR0IUY2_9EURO|nr:hypothetical protein LTS07_011432 [Exophiala sideris]KAK5048384.1 hypothetical protein LTR69_011423 [Exophiala sideris]